eukprot:6175575-Pleurochrysis_carterae.AAC.1
MAGFKDCVQNLLNLKFKVPEEERTGKKTGGEREGKKFFQEALNAERRAGQGSCRCNLPEAELFGPRARQSRPSARSPQTCAGSDCI